MASKKTQDVVAAISIATHVNESDAQFIHSLANLPRLELLRAAMTLNGTCESYKANAEVSARKVTSALSEVSKLKLEHARAISRLRQENNHLKNISNYNNARATVLGDSFDVLRDVLSVYAEPAHWGNNQVSGSDTPWEFAQQAINSIPVKAVVGTEGAIV